MVLPVGMVRLSEVLSGEVFRYESAAVFSNPVKGLLCILVLIILAISFDQQRIHHTQNDLNIY